MLSPESFTAAIEALADSPPSSKAARLALAELLAAAHNRTGDVRFKTAAGILRGATGGRPKCNDAAALKFARTQLRAGFAKTKNQAIQYAAVRFAAPDEVDNMTRRLVRKMKDQ